MTILNLLSLGIFFYLIFYATKSFKLNIKIKEIKFLKKLFRHIYVSLVAKNENERNLSATSWCYYPASTQPPKDIPLWSYFGRVVSDHVRTKIRRIKFLTYFGSVIAGMHLASEIIENFREKIFYWKCSNWHIEDVPRTSLCRCHFGTFLGRSLF